MVSIPQSIRNYSLGKVLRLEDSIRDAHKGNILDERDTGIRIWSNGERRVVGFRELMPASAKSVLEFSVSGGVRKIIREYSTSEFYPFDCERIAQIAFAELRNVGIDGMVYHCTTNELYQPCSILKHDLVVTFVELDNILSPWVFDFSADQHIGMNLISNPHLQEERARLVNVIQEQKTQCTPLIGPASYFEDLYRY